MKKKNLIIFILLLALFVGFTLLIKNVDVKAVGPNGSEVGFADVNTGFHDLTNNPLEYNKTIYKVTEIAGYVALLLVAFYGVIGLMQLIKRKSLAKVDRSLYVLLGLYVIMLAAYVLFDKFAVNYRPVLMDGKLEASFPSSHTLLAICVCVSAMIMNNRLFKNKNVKICNYLICALMCLIILGRLISGVHWLTDVVGGIILSSALLYGFNSILNYKKR